MFILVLFDKLQFIKTFCSTEPELVLHRESDAAAHHILQYG